MTDFSQNGHIKKDKTTNPFVMLASSIRKLTVASMFSWASILGGLFAIFMFFSKTQATNKDLPAIVDKFEKHEKKDDANVLLFVNAVNEIKISVNKLEGKIDLVNQKVDDVKIYGVEGQYHRETREAIKISNDR